MRPWRSNIPFAADSGKLLAIMDLPSDWNVGNGKKSPLPTVAPSSGPAKCWKNYPSITVWRSGGATGQNAARGRWPRLPGAARRPSNASSLALVSSSEGGGWHERGFPSAVAPQIEDLFRSDRTAAKRWAVAEPLRSEGAWKKAVRF